MQSMSYSTARNHLRQLMTDVCDNYEPVTITSKDGKNVVVLPLDEYNAIQETLYLLQVPANRERLLASIQQAEHGKLQERELLE